MKRLHVDIAAQTQQYVDAEKREVDMSETLIPDVFDEIDEHLLRRELVQREDLNAKRAAEGRAPIDEARRV